jgi:hypothetical protein
MSHPQPEPQNAYSIHIPLVCYSLRFVAVYFNDVLFKALVKNGESIARSLYPMAWNYATEVPARYTLTSLHYGLEIFHKLMTIKDTGYIYSQRSHETMVECGGRV